MTNTDDKLTGRMKMKRAVVMRHRKDKNLCLRCGKDIHEGDCIEDYTKADMRTKVMRLKIEVDSDKKKNTIISYRKKKNLCERCGKEKHIGECKEDYTQSDNRTKSEIKSRPAIVSTPKEKKTSILEEMLYEKNIDLEVVPNEKVSLFRDFIVIILKDSKHGNRIEFSCINQLSKRFKDLIICLIGDVEKHFVYSDLLKLKTFTNIHLVKTNDIQTIVNYIGSCKKLFTYPDTTYSSICIKYKIPIYEFSDKKNVTNFLPSEAYHL